MQIDLCNVVQYVATWIKTKMILRIDLSGAYNIILILSPLWRPNGLGQYQFTT